MRSFEKKEDFLENVSCFVRSKSVLFVYFSLFFGFVSFFRTPAAISVSDYFFSFSLLLGMEEFKRWA